MIPPRLPLIVLLAIPVLLTTGCEQGGASAVSASVSNGDTPEIPVGSSCKVQFRRNVLGASATLPISPNAGSINGAEVSVSGRLVAMNEEWVVISDSEGYESWIPRDAVLLVRARRPKPRGDATNGNATHSDAPH